MNELPAVLALYVGAETLRFCVERERLVLFVGRDSRIGRHTHGAAHEWRSLVRHGHVLSRTSWKGNPLHAIDPQHLGKDVDCASEALVRHRYDPGPGDREHQRIPGIPGSAARPRSLAGGAQRWYAA